MSQISLPLRVVLIAALSFLAVWMVALRPKAAVEPAAPAPAAPAAAAPAPEPAKPATREPAQPAAPAVKDSDEAVAALSELGPVQRALQDGRVVVLLFWDPAGAVDAAARRAVRAATAGERGVTTVTTTAAHVTRYGRITRAVQIKGTPTVVIVDRERQASTLTGFIDEATVRQALAAATR